MFPQGSFTQPMITVPVVALRLAVSFDFKVDWASSSAQVPSMSLGFIPCSNHVGGYAEPGPSQAFVGEINWQMVVGGQATGGETIVDAKDEDWPMGEA